jgi:flagellar basal body rod protein FlgC
MSIRILITLLSLLMGSSLMAQSSAVDTTHGNIAPIEITIKKKPKDYHKKIRKRQARKDHFNPSFGRVDPYVEHYNKHPIAPVQSVKSQN